MRPMSSDSGRSRDQANDAEVIADLRAQVAALTAYVARLESGARGARAALGVPAVNLSVVG